MLSQRDWIVAFVWAVLLHCVLLGVALWQWQPHTVSPVSSQAPFVVKLAPLAKASSDSQELRSAQAQSAQVPPPPKAEPVKPNEIGLLHDGNLAIAKKPKEEKTLEPLKSAKAVVTPKSEPQEVAKPPEPNQPKPEIELSTEAIAQQPSASSQAREIDAEKLAEQNQAQQQGQDTQLAMVAQQNWQSALIAHLAQKKRYPKLAQKRRQEATVMVRFTIDNQGRALDIEIMQASRYPLLNREALRVIKRAQPLPLPPQQFLNTEVIVPVRFYLL